MSTSADTGCVLEEGAAWRGMLRLYGLGRGKTSRTVHWRALPLCNSPDLC